MTSLWRYDCARISHPPDGLYVLLFRYRPCVGIWIAVSAKCWAIVQLVGVHPLYSMGHLGKQDYLAELMGETPRSHFLRFEDRLSFYWPRTP